MKHILIILTFFVVHAGAMISDEEALETLRTACELSCERLLKRGNGGDVTAAHALVLFKKLVKYPHNAIAKGQPGDLLYKYGMVQLHKEHQYILCPLIQEVFKDCAVKIRDQ